MRVRNILEAKATSSIYWVTPDTTIQNLLEKLAEHNVGALIVSEDGKSVTGIVSERDVVRKMIQPDVNRSKTVADIMTKAAALHTASPDDTFHALMELMTQKRIRHVPIVDESGLVGVLSIGDVVKHRMQQLEFERDQLNSYVTDSSS